MSDEILECNVVMPRHNGERKALEDMGRVIHTIKIDGTGFFFGPLKPPKVERVIFNGPATIVIWDDGSKTVVKCSECAREKNIKCPYEAPDKCDLYDRQKGLMAAMLKRLYKGAPDVLREWC